MGSQNQPIDLTTLRPRYHFRPDIRITDERETGEDGRFGNGFRDQHEFVEVSLAIGRIADDLASVAELDGAIEPQAGGVDSSRALRS